MKALDPVYERLGAYIAMRRKQLDLTQHFMAKRIGKSRGALANIETGRQQIVLHDLFVIAEACCITPVELLRLIKP